MVPDSLPLPLPEPPLAPALRRPAERKPARRGKRGPARPQGDLFAFPRRPVTEAPEPAAAPVEAPAVAVPEGLESVETAAVIDRLAALLDDDRPAMAAFVALADDLGRRRAQTAVPVLVRLAHRFAGFDRDAAAPEMRAALRALARIADAGCATAVTDLATLDALSSESLALALDVLAAVRHRPAAPLARRHLGHEAPTVRVAACALAARLRLRETAPTLEALLTDPTPTVARAAALALGGLAHPAGKAPLETWLSGALPHELPAVIAALGPVADGDTAILLGRAAERADLDGRLAVVAALGAIDGRAPVTWLARLARDRLPAVRTAVATALEATTEPDAAAPVLRELAADDDPAVAEAAEQALEALAEAVAEW